MEILKKFDNQLLERTDVEAVLEYDKATPSNKEVAKMIASKVGSSEELVVVKRIGNEFGRKKALVEAVVYKSKEAMEKTEKKTKKQRELEKKQAEEAKKAEQEKKAAEAAEATAKKEAEAKAAEEKPAEEAPKEGE